MQRLYFSKELLRHVMISRLKKLLRWPVVVLLSLMLLSLGNDALRLNPAQQAGAPFMYDLFQWEAANFLDKWVYRLSRFLPWNSLSQEEKLNRVEEYFRLGEDVRRLEADLYEATAKDSDDASLARMTIESELEEIKGRRKSLRNDVEEVIEATISTVVAEEDIGTLWKLIFPPVDMRLTDPPKLLVTSPRDRIERTHDVLLSPSIAVEEREDIERELLEDSNLAALVINIGGIATYPASIPGSQPLQWTLQLAAHEWLHHYFFFHPLGQNMFNSTDMQILNETVADIAGREIGDRAFELLENSIESIGLRGEMPQPMREMEGAIPERAGAAATETFDFGREMRETRLRVDGLLSEGMVEEAEAYMEERRRLFVDNGFNIRKLNQAFFAFNGTYADSPASVSPVGDQLRRFRSLMPDLETFVKTIG
ncbi:MAG: hypothetical protein IIB15_06655, partial [Chloroflexi bacterium]|nr:hypothetical protein [Chloroflexota bacterium]